MKTTARKPKSTLRDLLKEALTRMEQYQMDVDESPTRDHAEFMARLRAALLPKGRLRGPRGKGREGV